jgi:hypothetical protein
MLADNLVGKIGQFAALLACGVPPAVDSNGNAHQGLLSVICYGTSPGKPLQERLSRR